MNWKKIIIGVLLALIVLVAGFAGWLVYDDMTNYDLYKNKVEGISMKYPKGWKLTQYPDGGAIAVMVKPKANAFVQFNSNWNISATTLNQPLTLDEYTKAANAQVQFMFQQVSATARKVNLSGHEGREIVYLPPVKQDGLVILTYVFIYKGVAYNVMYMGAKEDYTDPVKKRVLDHVIGSLKVTF